VCLWLSVGVAVVECAGAGVAVWLSVCWCWPQGVAVVECGSGCG